MLLNPFMLAGVGAVALPIVIHLLSRRQLKRTKWAAMRFLATTVEKTKRRLNVEDLLLLLLRCLAIAILAIVFARPALSGAAGGWFGEPPITGVIVLDRSMSMSRTDGTTTRFEHAKSAVDRILDAAPKGSSFALFLASDDVDAVIPQPTLDLNLVRQTVRKAEVTDRSTRLQPALRQAVDLLQAKAAARREIHVVTDGQASGLSPLSSIQQVMQSAEASDIRARMVVVTDPDRENVAVTSVRLEGGMFVAHRVARFGVEIANTGANPARNIRVSLRVGDAPPSDEQTIFVLAAGERQRVTLSLTPTDAGLQAVTASVAPDRLPADDTRTIAVRAVESVSVLIVDTGATTDRRDSASFFLRNAFAPVAREQQADYFIKTRTISPGELSDARLDDQQCVVLCNVADFTPAQADKLQNYVRRGGGLIVFTGPSVNAGAYNDQLGKPGLLPAKLNDAVGDANARDKPFAPSSDSFEHEIASIWNDPNAGSPASVRVFRAFDLTPDETPCGNDIGPARAVLRFTQSGANGTLAGKPLLIERSFGAGRVLLCATTADTRWTDLPVKPAVLVPLLQRTLATLVSGTDDAMNVPVGRPVRRVTGGDLLGREASVVRPAPHSGKPQDPTLLAPPDTVAVQLSAGRPTFSFDATDRAGAYTATFTGEPALKWVFASQSDPAESNLTPASDTELASLEPTLNVVRWNPTGDAADTLAASGATEIWSLFAGVALLLFVSEVLLGNWFSRSK